MKKSFIVFMILGSFSSFAETQDCLGNICKGHSALSGDYVGKVTGIKNNKVIFQYLIDGSVSEMDPNTLSREIPSKNNLKKDIYAVDGSYVGKVLRVFENGKVEFKYDVDGSTSVIKDASPEISNKGNLKTGAKAVNETYTGKVVRVFENGKIEFKYDVDGSKSVINNASPEIGNKGNIKAGVKAVNETYTGKVLTVFENGKIEFKYDIDGSKSVINNASPETTNLGNLKSGVSALASTYTGKVINVFENGKIEFKYDVDGSKSIINSASPETKKHAKYQKEVAYATTDYDIVKALRFFENGKIEVEGSGTYLCETLFEEVQELEGLKLGDELITPNSIVAIQRLFANNTAEILIDGKLTSVRILTEEDLTNSYVRNYWVSSIKVDENQFTFPAGSAVKKKDYKKLLELIKKDLNVNVNDKSKEKLKKIIDSELKKLN